MNEDFFSDDLIVKEPEVVHAERDHALLSPSAGKRWVNCQASPWLIRQIGDPQQAPNEHMLYGTKGHEWSEVLGRHLLLNNDIISYKNQLDDYIAYCNTDEAIRKKEQDLAYYVSQYVAWTKKLHDEIIRVRKPKSTKVFIELKVRMYKETWGTADFVLLCENQDGTWDVVVADLKLGKGVKVDAENNEQIELYAIGAVKTCLPEGAKINKVRGFIYQPRVDPENPWKSMKLDQVQLLDRNHVFLEAHDNCLKILDQGPTEENFCVGEWCRFCPALAVCDTYRKKHSTDIGFLIEEDTDLVAHNVPLERVIAAVKAKKSIERFLSECEHYLMVQLQQGKKVPGYKLVGSRSQRKWKDDEQVRKALAQLLKINGCKEPYESKLIGITKAKQYISDDGMKPYVEMTKSKLQLATEDDKRPEIPFTDAASLLIDEGENE